MSEPNVKFTVEYPDGTAEKVEVTPEFVKVAQELGLDVKEAWCRVFKITEERHRKWRSVS